MIPGHDLLKSSISWVVRTDREAWEMACWTKTFFVVAD